MCEPASMIVTKNKVFWSKKTESHHEIIEEFGLKEQDVRKNFTLIPIEIIPPDNDYKLPLSKWVFKIDFYERDLPDWWEAKTAERRVRVELKKWRKAKVVMPKEKIDSIEVGQKIAIYGTVNNIRGGTVNNISGGTVNDIWGGTVNNIRGGTDNNIRGGTVNYISGGTVNYISGDFPQKITGNTTIITYSALSPDILKSSQAVLIDRTKNPVVCHVGK